VSHRRKRCLKAGCARFVEPGPSWCGEHWPARANNQWGHNQAFRAAVLAKDGYRCTHQGPHGRCTEERIEKLQAHHTQPGNEDPSTGLTLCRVHHGTEVGWYG
jgi:hypothetical protein